MKATSGGLRNPNAARPTPMLSTTSVPTKFCMMVQQAMILASENVADLVAGVVE
jgi:hypothetical protein